MVPKSTDMVPVMNFLRFGCSSPVLWLILWVRFLRSRLPPEGVILVPILSCIYYTAWERMDTRKSILSFTKHSAT